MLEFSKKRNNILFNFRNTLKKIKKSADYILNQYQMFLFGSALEGRLVAGSDIDVLIVTDIPKDHMKRAEIIAKIEEKARLPMYHPFEFHILDFKEFENWKNLYKLKLEKL